jgi:hypothetical protein
MADSDMDPREDEMDRLLRRTMGAPVPRLSPDFHKILLRELRRRSQQPSQFGWILLAGYGGVSSVVSILVMHSQGLGWEAIAVMMVGTLVTLALARRLPSGQQGAY